MSSACVRARSQCTCLAVKWKIPVSVNSRYIEAHIKTLLVMWVNTKHHHPLASWRKQLHYYMFSALKLAIFLSSESLLSVTSRCFILQRCSVLESSRLDLSVNRSSYGNDRDKIKHISVNVIRTWTEEMQVADSRQRWQHFMRFCFAKEK